MLADEDPFPPFSATELLILAHNCFSLTCHMEGITRVLQAARLLTEEHLAPNEEYGLVVRDCSKAALFVGNVNWLQGHTHTRPLKGPADSKTSPCFAEKGR